MKKKKTKEDSRGIVWLLCYLNGKDSFYQTISDLGHALGANGIRLIVFGPYEPDRSFTGFDYFFVPFSLVEQGARFKNAIMGRSATFGWLVDELIASEQEWCGIASPVEAEHAIIRAASFWERAFELMRPVLILAWGSSIPLSRLMLRLAQGRQIASYIFERGLFEDTISFNLVGHFALSNIGLRGQFIEPYSNDADLLPLWGNIERYYTSPANKKYDGYNIDEDIPSSEFVGKTIVYLGAFDVNLHNTTEQYELTDRVGSFAKNSAEGLQFLVSALSRVCPGARLLVKPHPMRPFEILEDCGVNLTYLNNVDIRTLVRNCDVCVTTFTSSQVLPFIFDKPLITLSNDFFFGRDVSYAAQSQDELDRQLQSAINREGWDQKLLNGRKLIAALFRDDLIGTNDAVPTRLKLNHLVHHLSRFSRLTPRNLKLSSQRISDFRNFEAASRELSRPPTASTFMNMLGKANWDSLYSEIQEQTLSDFKKDLEGVRHLDWLHSERIRIEAESMRSLLERAESDRDNLQLRLAYLQANESSLSNKNRALNEKLAALEVSNENLSVHTRDLRDKLIAAEENTSILQARNSSLVEEILATINSVRTAPERPRQSHRQSFRMQTLITYLLGLRHKIGRFF
ncbi:hypothetical protein [Pararhizobium sp. DWP3-4]|uniref:hypothetical protein n=1 Tax=Pararhizobium sp. DWP3-4 TaxID=2804565 RepID=UPI003CF883CC